MESLLPNVKNIILVASGKGGVGKSTVAANLAVSLSREGYKTGILDADLYGPSIPKTLGVEEDQTALREVNGKNVIEPVMSYGIKVMSLGFLMKPEDAVIWRGPMVSKALTQLIEETNWGELEYLVIDMPPGTGDISITIAQKLPQSKAIIVITPQKMASADGLKAATMFRSNGVEIPILGVVENMSYFTPEKHPEEKYYLFGINGGKQLAEEIKAPLLSQIPLVEDVCQMGDSGKTVFGSSSKAIVEAYEDLAATIHEKTMVEA